LRPSDLGERQNDQDGGYDERRVNRGDYLLAVIVAKVINPTL